MIRLAEHVPLRPWNSFGIEARARWWAEVDDEEDAVAFLMDNAYSSRPLLLLGGGSNVLFTRDFEGLVLRVAIRGRELLRDDGDEVLLRFGAGENWHEGVRWSLEQGWGGLENLSLIPGTMGAAPIQNIGAYGVELCDVFESLEAIHLPTGQLHHFSRADCQFGYRDSVFKQRYKGQYLIARVCLRLARSRPLHTDYGDIRQELAKLDHPPGHRDVSEAVIRIRQSKLPDPAQIGNAGSFFKNPVVEAAHYEALAAQYPSMPHYPQADGRVKVPAGWLIEACGWKGHRRGACGVHERQALVLVNHGGASGAEILALSEEIQASVAQRFGIALEREVNLA